MKTIRREVLKIDNGNGTYHYELGKPVEDKLPDRPIKEWITRFIAKLIYREPIFRGQWKKMGTVTWVKSWEEFKKIKEKKED